MKYEKNIEISKSKLEEYEKMFGYGVEELVENKLPILSTIETFNVEFDNGFEVDIKINTSEDDVWSEGILFDENGGTCCMTDVCDSLGGDWSFTFGDDEYVVNIIGV